MLNPVANIPTRPRLPPLENGDRLTRGEFHRRYEARADLKKAELIEGVVYVAAAAGAGFHGFQHSQLTTWLHLYALGTPGVSPAADSTLELDDLNEVQPDNLLFITAAAGGHCLFDEEGWLVGIPELVGEVSASSVSKDLHQKREAYRRNGVREYIVWRVLDLACDWFVLRNSRYEPLPADAAGIVRSETFPGLWLDVPALLRSDFAAVRRVLEEGLESPEHAAFVAGIQTRLSP